MRLGAAGDEASLSESAFRCVVAPSSTVTDFFGVADRGETKEEKALAKEDSGGLEGVVGASFLSASSFSNSIVSSWEMDPMSF